MVDHAVNTNLHKVIDKITTSTPKVANAKWFDEDITILLSSDKIGTTIIFDFIFSVSSIIEVTLNGTDYYPINENNELAGRQSRYIRVISGDQLNFKAKVDGDIKRIIVGEV